MSRRFGKDAAQMQSRHRHSLGERPGSRSAWFDRPWWLSVWVGLVLALASAHAHQPGLSYLSITVGESGATGRLDMSLRDLEFAVGLDTDGNGSVTYEELLGRQPTIADYVVKRLVFQADRQPAPLKVTGHQVAADQDGVYAVVEFEASSPGPLHTLGIDCRMFFDHDPQHRCLMQLEYQGEPRMAVFRSGDSTQQFELAHFTRWERFRDFTVEGIHHIWTGHEHLLFVIVLLLPAVLRSDAGAWQAVDRFKPAFISVFKIVTAFTIAHSITLSLATFRLVSMPTKWVDLIVDASVALAALNNLWPRFRGRGWLLAFGFGLVHGFGFASALTVLDLAPGTLALALVSFNVGVEAGQLAVVAAFLPLAYRLRATRFYRRFALGVGSAGIACLALIWMCGRLLGTRLLPF